MDSFDTVIVGTGFASSFFLAEHLKRAGKKERILVLERGTRQDPAARFATRKVSDVAFDPLYINRTPQKRWIQTIAFGGGSCWTGNTPRMHPNDFRTKTLYGVGEDWPITYDELEPYYLKAERVMGIAGSAEGPFPRSAGYPFPPHRMNAFDRLVAKKYPGLHIPLPSARSSAVASGRPVCCGAGVCSICPINSKFQIDLHMNEMYADPRITLVLGAEVLALDIQGNRVSGVRYRKEGREHTARASLAVVGAHAIMTPFILLRSGLQDSALGRYLNEQIGVSVQVDLRGVDSFDGGQAVSGLGLMFLDGAFRRERPGCLVESWNVPWMRAEKGRWRQRAFLKFVFEDVPERDNHVALAKEDPDRPAVYYPKHSAYMKAGLASVPRLMEQLAEGLPIEGYEIMPPHDLGGSAHIQGTTRMGKSGEDSVVDADLRHHTVRNLIVVGGGSFPTCHAANPTLTLCALSMRAAARLH